MEDLIVGHIAVGSRPPVTLPAFILALRDPETKGDGMLMPCGVIARISHTISP